MRTLDLGQAYIGHFPLFEDDGVTKRSGVAVFITTVWRDGAAVVLPVTIAEIGATGEYRATFTPTQAGAWGLEVYAPATGERWGEDLAVIVPEVQWGFTASDDNTNFECGIWLERSGQRQTDVASIAAVIRSLDGATVVNLGTSAAPTAHGVFEFTTPSLTLPANEYYLDVTATRGAAAWYGVLGLQKV